MASPVPAHSRLECSICLQMFQTPKILPCFHTFCQRCLERLVGGAQLFRCPSCRRDTAVPRGGVCDFQSNFYITEELEERRTRRKEKCVIHENQDVSFVCKRCNVLICQTCYHTRHVSHRVLPLEQMVASAKDDLKKMLAGLRDRSTKLEAALGEVSEGDAALELKRQAAKRKIVERTKTVVAKLVKVQDDALKSVDTFFADYKSKRSETILRSQKDQQETKSLEGEANHALQYERGASVLATRDRLKETVTGQESLEKLAIGFSRVRDCPSTVTNDGVFVKILDALASQPNQLASQIEVEEDEGEEEEEDEEEEEEEGGMNLIFRREEEEVVERKRTGWDGFDFPAMEDVIMSRFLRRSEPYSGQN